MNRVKILGAPVDCVDMVGVLCYVSDYVASGTLHQIVTLNAEILYRAQSQPQMLELINQADLVTPDGSGIVWAVKKLTGKEITRVTGIDLMAEICEHAKKNSWRLFFLGAAPGVAEAAAKRVSEEFEADVCGHHDGYFKPEDEANLVAEINEQAPDILFVAMGAPKQEEWIDAHRHELKASVVIGVGGSFDVIAGNVKRAPSLFQKLGLEWLWRLIRQPSRIGRMMTLPKFTLLVNRVAKEKNRTKQA